MDDFPEGWMDERECGRVERVAVELDRRACTRLSVHRVADDRVAQRCQVDANLVGASGLEARLQERVVVESLEHTIASDRTLAAAGRPYGHLDSIRGMAADRRVDDAFMRSITSRREKKAIAPMSFSAIRAFFGSCASAHRPRCTCIALMF